MNNNQLYDTLEICLHALKNGANIDSVLARYPQQASELRPILEASQRAREITVPRPSADVIRRRRAQLLQRASEMREARRKPVWRKSAIPFFQRMAFALTLAVAFLMSGTGLVQASSSALPGENLYPVKRTWEDVRLLFIFTPGIREAISGRYEQERLDEVSELLREGRVVSIKFTGLVTADQDGNLLVSGVRVAVNSKTLYSGDQLATGMAVTVTGQTDAQGQVTAMSLQVLPPGAFVPTGEPAEEEEASENDTSFSPTAGPGNGNSSQSNQNESSEKPQNNAPDTRSGSFHIEGTVQSIQGDVWIIDGQTVFMDNVILQDGVAVGSKVEVKGYFTTDGRFIVTRVEIKNSDRNNGDKKNNDNEDSSDVNENSNVNVNSNDNGNLNENDNGNWNENGNGDDNSNDNENPNSNDNWNSNSNSNDNEHHDEH